MKSFLLALMLFAQLAQAESVIPTPVPTPTNQEIQFELVFCLRQQRSLISALAAEKYTSEQYYGFLLDALDQVEQTTRAYVRLKRKYQRLTNTRGRR